MKFLAWAQTNAIQKLQLASSVSIKVFKVRNLWNIVKVKCILSRGKTSNSQCLLFFPFQRDELHHWSFRTKVSSFFLWYQTTHCTLFGRRRVNSSHLIAVLISSCSSEQDLPCLLLWNQQNVQCARAFLPRLALFFSLISSAFDASIVGLISICATYEAQFSSYFQFRCIFRASVAISQKKRKFDEKKNWGWKKEFNFQVRKRQTMTRNILQLPSIFYYTCIRCFWKRSRDVLCLSFVMNGEVRRKVPFSSLVKGEREFQLKYQNQMPDFFPFSSDQKLCVTISRSGSHNAASVCASVGESESCKRGYWCDIYYIISSFELFNLWCDFRSPTPMWLNSSVLLSCDRNIQWFSSVILKETVRSYCPKRFLKTQQKLLFTSVPRPYYDNGVRRRNNGYGKQPFSSGFVRPLFGSKKTSIHKRKCRQITILLVVTLSLVIAMVRQCCKLYDVLKKVVALKTFSLFPSFFLKVFLAKPQTNKMCFFPLKLQQEVCMSDFGKRIVLITFPYTF